MLLGASFVPDCRLRFESIKWFHVYFLTSVSVLSLWLIFYLRDFDVHPCLLVKFSQTAFVKTLVHLDVTTRKNPSAWPERHSPVSSRDQESAFTVLAHDTPCNFEISSLQLAQSTITGCRMAHFYLVVALKMWYASRIPLWWCV